ncbi:hypothetical protein GYMLUDRAFT_45326 [Collybiopsis luxurians FD-317 M1]|uniref:P-loop containing nucleoside triphosphate hydrolase protein n=1 Tax=Collybiopsis luxurians FD-317 M1 TaxID=944289 RepID=A0A0D0C7N5_9AGAR|nr:hypothetical protein GYMLUDRAFT_45326 [Collybiopsis luxurians FD-317 M1]
MVIALQDVQVAIPGCVALLSLAVLSAQRASEFLVRKWQLNHSDNAETVLTATSTSVTRKFLQILRLIGCLALLVLTALPASRVHCVHDEQHVEGLSGIYIAYTYTTIIAFISLLVKSFRWRAVLTRHLCIVLLSTWLVCGYRNILPLATFSETPSDLCKGWVLWAEITILTVTAIIIPAAMPREYIPVDPKHPMLVPNPEQTASLFSLGFFFFLDPVVFEAYYVPHLPFDRLPPLADDDSIRNLKAAHFRRLDPFSGAKSRNYLLNLIRSFSFVTILLWSLSASSAVFQLLGPIAINNLLKYLERGKEGAMMRPWFWVLLLLLNPVLNSLIVEWYLRVSLQTLVRMEALLTQLVFEHALRIRVKAESSSDSQTGKQSRNLTGRINNLVTTDLAVINEARNCMALISEIPVLLALYSVFLYTILGWSAFVGVGITIIMAPIPTYIAGIARDYHAKRMKKTDTRVHILTDILNILRMVKMLGWEKRMLEKVSEARNDELRVLKKRQFIGMFGWAVNYSITIIAMAGTYGTYFTLTASTVFSSLVVFENMLRFITAIFMYWRKALAAKVSFDRITEFLNNTELLDIYETHSPTEVLHIDHGAQPPPNQIGFRNASFSWSSEDRSDGSATPSERRFILRVENELFFKKGCLNLITGPTGSGKTSLLLALLSEMHFIPLGPDSYCHLPREKGVAYAAQESWVQNETIKNNILFASEYNEARYKEVIHVCGLERDLELFEAGDETEVGEKGLTLSGGQKARVTLARAIYSSAEVLLLDDVLAALDVHTSKWIIEKCLAGDLVKDRTVILVTHNAKLVEPIASSFTVVKDGKISEYRSCNPVPFNQLLKVLSDDTDEENKGDGEGVKAEFKPDGKLVVSEEIQEGRIGGNAIKLYLSAVGGDHTVFYFSALLATFVLTHTMGVMQTWFLGYWATQYELPGKVPIVFYLSIYVTILVIIVVSNIGTSSLCISGQNRGSRRIHKQLADAILGTTLRWLDKTPTSRILTRFTQDINAIDILIPEWARNSFDQTMKLAFKLAAIVLFTPLFLIPGVAALAAGYTCAQIYLKSQMSVKREMSVAKSPVLGHFGATVAGLASIRAYSAQAMATEELLSRIDKYSRSSRIFYNLQRWMAIRMHIISALFVGSLSWYLVYVKKDTASNTGFSINMAVTFTAAIFGWIININILEGQSMFLERIYAYVQVEQEAKPTEQGKPPAYWPATGELRVENLSARYSLEGPEVLHQLSFHIKSGERIGIVGRTGSGKSSLALSLLRCIHTTGDVIYDGIPTSSINLDTLRSNITIIPQVPELLSGTLRHNLDPFGEVDDLILNDSLRAAGLTALQDHFTGDEEKITLDTTISGGGSNLSVGQRQIITLARALVRRSKLLILDEGMSLVLNYKTDTIIQTSLRNELTDTTVITIAHRLQTIMDSDRIIVVDAGNIVEYGVPTELLKKKGGKLRALVEESNDKDVLFDLTGSRSR